MTDYTAALLAYAAAKRRAELTANELRDVRAALEDEIAAYKQTADACAKAEAEARAALEAAARAAHAAGEYTDSVTFRCVTKLVIDDEDAAIAWAQQHAPHALKLTLDRRALTAALKGREADGARLEEESEMVVAKLGHVLMQHDSPAS